MISDPWYYYVICFGVGALLGAITIGMLIARDPAVVKLEEGMVVTSRDFIEKMQKELLELKNRMKL